VSVVATTSVSGCNGGCGGTIGVIPRQVRLTIQYYQRTKGRKRIISSSIFYVPRFQCHTYTNGGAQQAALEAGGIPQCVTDFTGGIATSEYQLEVQFIPLEWLTLLNQFAFAPPIYLFFFFVVGVITIGFGAFMYILNRLLTRLRFPPRFHGFTLFTTVSFPIVFGAMLGCGPVMFGVMTIWAWFRAGPDGGAICSMFPEDSPSNLCLEDVFDWAGEQSVEQLRNGRKALLLISIGAFTTILYYSLVLPNYSEEEMKPDAERAAMKELKKKQKQKVAVQLGDDEDELPPSPMFKPYLWRRFNAFMAVIFMIVCGMIHMEFSYSAEFDSQTSTYIVVFKIIYFVLDVVLLEPLLQENMLFANLDVFSGAISNMATMGASSFIDFIFSYFVDFFFTIIERFYAAPFVKESISLAPRWMLILRRRLRGNKKMTRVQRALEEQEWRRVNDEIELEFDGIEPMLDSYVDYACDSMSTCITPVVYVCLELFYYESQIAEIYDIGLNQIIYYIVFAVLFVPYALITDVFLHNTQELIHGWKVYEYVVYQRYRFTVREHRWVLRNNIMDESIDERFQKIDQLCFSSQFYYLIAFQSLGMCLTIIGITTVLRQEYNILGDKMTIPLIAILFLAAQILGMVLIRLADVQVRRLNWRGLWVTKLIEGTVDDDVAAKLQIGEGRQQDLEQERRELAALNSDRFKHQFLERNRPWILQHLVDLLTPRALDMEGPDGRPTIEYVRDVYNVLMGLGEGLRKVGDRADISSDEDDDALEAQRKDWTQTPLTGASLAIARMWLAKARKRRAFSKLVRGIVDQNKKSACEKCGRTVSENGVRLVCHIATRGQPDTTAMDRHITGFEMQYSVNELDPNLWKAYFRAHAEYCTRCNICEDAVEMDKLMQQGRAPGAGNITRPQDISSDEDEDEIEFDPLVVTRTSPEGRMMSKWLLAARKKLGGAFPRPDARRQMEKYAQKLKELKRKKVREAIQGPKAADASKPDPVEQSAITAATKALAQRWVRMARDNLESKFRTRGFTLKDELDKTLGNMREEDDWYYGGALRMEGKDLLKQGADLEEDRRILETEAAVKISKIEKDRDKLIEERATEMDRERRVFEAKVSQQADRINLDIDLRREELEKSKEGKRREFQLAEKQAAEEFGAAPTEMVMQHKAQLAEIDQQIEAEREKMESMRDEAERESRAMFEKSQLIKRSEVERRKAMAQENISRIREELAQRLKNAETAWQQSASRWVAVAKRKVETKRREDEEARVGKRKRKGK
jgi:hypothetical protein